jgi:hypothetical protein
VRQFLRTVRDSEFIQQAKANLVNAREKLSTLFRTFYRKAGRPTFEPKLFRKGQLPIAEDWNSSMQAIRDDLVTAYEELHTARDIAVLTNNYNQIITEELAKRAAEAASKVIDLRLLSGQLQPDLIVAGDDFNNLDKVDQSFSLQNPLAEVLTDQGAVTLKRVEAVNVLSPDVSVKVDPLGGINRNAGVENTNRFYEGKFFGYLGEARPEGGAFHLEEKVSPDAIVSGDSEVFEINMYKTNSLGEFDFSQFPDQRFVGVQGRPLNENRTGLALRPEDIQVIDRGATPEELAEARHKMIDGNPATFWECEYVKPIPEKWLPKDVGIIGGVINAVAGEEPKELTPADLRALAGLVDAKLKFDLEIEVTLELPTPQNINFVLLNPQNFSETAWLEVYELSSAASESAIYEVIEGFDQNQFDNVLTDEANEELNADQSKVVLSPDKYSYRGLGVWSFPVRMAKFVRFKIRQRTPVPDPYQRLVIQLRRLLTKTSAYKEEAKSLTREVLLTYEQTLQIVEDASITGQVAGVTPGTSAAGSQTTGGKAPNQALQILTGGLCGGGEAAQTTSFSINDTGWDIVRTWRETFWDKIRYGIGIRDIGVFHYRFTPAAEIVSVPFRTPKEVLKVELRVDEAIPSVLPDIHPWILYYISHDEGDTWLRINPLDKPAVFESDGSVIPRTITFNLDDSGDQGDTTRSVTTAEPVRAVRFRAVLATDTTLDNGDRYTPVLKSYRLLILPRGGLRDSGI